MIGRLLSSNNWWFGDEPLWKGQNFERVWSLPQPSLDFVGRAHFANIYWVFSQASISNGAVCRPKAESLSGISCWHHMSIPRKPVKYYSCTANRSLPTILTLPSRELTTNHIQRSCAVHSYDRCWCQRIEPNSAFGLSHRTRKLDVYLFLGVWSLSSLDSYNDRYISSWDDNDSCSSSTTHT